MIRGVKFASVPTRDQDRGIEFWTERVGFRVLTDQPFDERQRWIELTIPGSSTGLVLFTAEGQEPGGLSNVAFYADDVVATCEEMKARGVEFEQEPRVAEWGTSAIFLDGEGNRFVLSSR